MVKKQAFVVLMAFMSLMGSAFGLGLGDIEVKSNLNDPLDAEIKLIQLKGLTAGEILPTLASNDDFRRAGVERSFFLSNIQFRIKENESGDLVVTLVTRQVVREPFLNFLVEVNWPGGRLLKEYTVLLDPPVFDTGLAVDALVVEQTGSNVAATDLITTTVIEQGDVTASEVVATPTAPRSDSLTAGEYRVERNDTLWEIALKVPDRNGYSPQQVMLAIQDLNPQAFLNGNINRVKAGSVLTLPDGRQIATRSLDEAVSEVQAQNKGAAPNLRAPVTESSEVQLSATETTSSALQSGDGEKNPDGYLELTAGSESSTTTASGESSATVDQLQNQLSVAEELNDQFERERDELESRVDELQEQIAIMERLLDVQNTDLAQVQDALATPDTTDDSTVDTSATDTADDTTTVEPVVQPVQTPTVQTPVVQQPVQAPAPQGVVEIAADYANKASNWVMSSTTNMGITGGALLVLLLLPFYLRSKRAGSKQTLGEMNAEEVSYEEPEDFTADLDDDLLAEVEDEFDEEESDEPETLNAVVEAEMYMAYQKYDQAEEKLKEAFADHPDRSDVGIKLLEVYAETGDGNAFNELENRLLLDAEQQGVVEDLKSKLPIGGSSDDDLASDLMADDLNLDLNVDDEITPITADADLDFDLDLGMEAEPAAVETSDDFDFDLSDDSESESLEISLDEPAVAEPEEATSDLDFSLDLGDLDETAESDSESDLDFSLEGLESESLDLGLSEEPAVVESSSEDLDFSLDLDDSSLELSVAEEPEETSLDVDLGLSDEDDLSLESALDNSSDLDIGSLEDDSGLDFSMDTELSLDDELDTGLELTGEGDLESLDSESVELGSDNALEQLANSLDSDAELEEDEFDFLSGSDEASTKLDLARAYIEMDDKEGARDILEEVASEGTDDQKAQAQELMTQL
jgi:pilus assembly protein FimV